MDVIYGYGTSADVQVQADFVVFLQTANADDRNKNIDKSLTSANKNFWIKRKWQKPINSRLFNPQRPSKHISNQFICECALC